MLLLTRFLFLFVIIFSNLSNAQTSLYNFYSNKKIEVLSENEKKLKSISELLSFSSYIIYDNQSKMVLDKKKGQLDVVSNVYRDLMFLYIIFDNIKTNKIQLNDYLRIPTKFPQYIDDNVKLELGDRVSVAKLLDLVIYAKSEKAKYILLRKISGNPGSFVSLMNIYAGKIGMFDTIFKSVFQNSARDFKTNIDGILNFVLHFYKNFSEYVHILNKEKITFNGIEYKNNNPFVGQNFDTLLFDKFYDERYYGVIRKIENGREFFIIINGADYNIMDKIFIKYLNIINKTHINNLIYKKGDVVKKVKVLNGVKTFVNLTVDKDVYYTKFFGVANNVDINIKYISPIIAPFKKGVVGEIIINNNGVIIKNNLIVKRDIKRAGLFVKIVNKLSEFFEYLKKVYKNVYSF